MVAPAAEHGKTKQSVEAQNISDAAQIMWSVDHQKAVILFAKESILFYDYYKRYFLEKD